MQCVQYKEAELVEMLCCLPVLNSVGFTIGFDADGTYYSSVELGGARPYKCSLYVQSHTHTNTSGLCFHLIQHSKAYNGFVVVIQVICYIPSDMAG